MDSDRAQLIEDARSASAAGRFDEAAAIYRQLLLADPADRQAKKLNGIVDAKSGRYAEAILQLDEPLKLHPDDFEALIWLSVAFRMSGDAESAARVAERAAQIRPHDPEALNNLGVCLRALLMLPQATKALYEASNLNPSSAEIALNLGEVLFMQGLQENAIEAFQKAKALDPKSAPVHTGLGRVLMNQGRFEAALESAQQAVELDAAFAPAQILLAQLLIHAGRSEHALSHARTATSIEPENDLAHSVLGTALQSLGLMEQANEHFLKSIEIRPRQGNAYFAVVHGRRITEGDRDLLRKMSELSHDQSLPMTEVQMLHYALGRAYEQLRKYEDAMRHYDRANRRARQIKFNGGPFDREAHGAARDRVRTFFTPNLLEQFEGAGLDSERPIFILGMMRSGTTLMEQILSSHPHVEAGGELSFWTERGPYEYEPATGTLAPGRITGIANEYLALLKGISPDARRVTDKMPANDLVLGFIHIAFPKARIVHMVRNPADTCFSIYATPNEARVDFGHDKVSIAFAYEAHRKLMDHWRAILPANRLMDVVYEELIEDSERVTRQVLDFCGLEWNDACLAPEKNDRSVSTPSVWQVRQPVYKTSMDRWRNFAPWIPEFIALL